MLQSKGQSSWNRNEEVLGDGIILSYPILSYPIQSNYLHGLNLCFKTDVH